MAVPCLFHRTSQRPGVTLQRFCCHICSMSSYLPVSVGSLGNSYCCRSTYLFDEEDKELSRLCLAGVATVDVYVGGRFVEHFASVNRLGFATLQLSDDASIQHVCEYICIMLMCRHDLARREKDGFDQALFSRHIGKGSRHKRCFFCNLAICATSRLRKNGSELIPGLFHRVLLT